MFIDSSNVFSYAKKHKYNCINAKCNQRFEQKARAISHNCEKNTTLVCKSEILTGHSIRNWLNENNFAFFENANFVCYDIEAVNSRVTQDNKEYTGNLINSIIH